jgi:hypothetical protein
MNDNFAIEIASVPDREQLVAEIWWQDQQCCELSQEGDHLILELYPNQTGDAWRFTYDEFLEVLSRARDRLLGI